MGYLLPKDIGTAPIYVMEGRKPNAQCIILYLWQAALRGTKFTLSGIAKQAGVGRGTVAKVVKELVEEGVLVDTNLDRAPFTFNVDFLPSRPLPKGKEKKKVEFPTWVWDCLGKWTKVRGGFVGPKDVYTHLKDVYAEYGEKVAGEAYEAFLYVQETLGENEMPHFWPLKRFAANVGMFL